MSDDTGDNAQHLAGLAPVYWITKNGFVYEQVHDPVRTDGREYVQVRRPGAQGNGHVMRLDGLRRATDREAPPTTATGATRHVVTIEHKTVDATLCHRWHCSCDCSPGEWKTRESQAQQGGKLHASRSRRRSAP